MDLESRSAAFLLWTGLALSMIQPCWAAGVNRKDSPDSHKPVPAGEPNKPAAPALEFIGTASGEDGRVIFFITDGNSLLSVSQGDLVRGDLRVDGIKDGESLTLTQLQTRRLVVLPPHVASGPAAARVPDAPDEEQVKRTRKRKRDDD